MYVGAVLSRRANALDRMIARARSWAREGRWDEEAVALNTKILKKAPDRVGAYVRRGRCYLELGMLTEAEKDFRIALDKDPQNGEARELLHKTENLSESPQTDDWIRELVDSGAAQDEGSAEARKPGAPGALPELPTSPYTGSGAHSVYVVELDPDVLERSKFRAKNPGYGRANSAFT